MRIVYIADDGTEFDEEYKCQDYEFLNSLQYLEEYVEIYDNNGKRLRSYLREEMCDDTKRVIVSSTDGLKDLHKLSKYMGYYAYLEIDSVGEWHYSEVLEQFIKYKDITFIKGLSDKYIEKMNNCIVDDDKKQSHINADKVLADLLKELGYVDIVEMYNSLYKWYE